MSGSRSIRIDDLTSLTFVDEAELKDVAAVFSVPDSIFLQDSPTVLLKLNELFHPRHTKSDIAYLLTKMNDAGLIMHHYFKPWPRDIRLTNDIIRRMANQIYLRITLVEKFKKDPAFLRLIIRSFGSNSDEKKYNADVTLKTLLIQYSATQIFPSSDALRELWRKLSSEKPPFKVKNIVDLISPVFGDKFAKTLMAQLKESELPDLIAESNYQVFLDANRYNEKLLEILTQPNIKIAIINKFKNHPMSLSDFEKKCRLFHIVLSRLPVFNQTFVSALNQVLNMDLTDELNHLPSVLRPIIMPTPPSVNTNNTKLFESLRDDQQYADFMLRHEAIFTSFPRLKVIFEYGPIQKWLVIHKVKLKEKDLIKLIAELEKVKTAEDYRSVFHDYFVGLDDVFLDFLELLNAKIPDEMEETATIAQEIQVYHFFHKNEKTFKQLPELKKLLSSSHILPFFYHSKKGISSSFLEYLSNLPASAFDTKESICQAIVTTLSLEGEMNPILLGQLKIAIESTIDLPKLRGELRFYKYFAECSKFFMTAPELRIIFQNENIKKILCVYWSQIDNWPPSSIQHLLAMIQQVPDKKLLDIPAVIHAQLLKRGALEQPELQQALAYVLSATDLAKFKWHAQYESVVSKIGQANATLGRLLKGKYFIDFLWLNKIAPPSLDKITELTRELAQLTQPYQLGHVASLLMNAFSINVNPPQTTAFLDVLEKEGFSRRADECEPLIIRLKVNAKYALLFAEMHLSEFLQLQKIFEDEHVQKVLFSHWKSHAIPGPHAILRFLAEFATLSRADHAAARRALSRFIFNTSASSLLNAAFDKANFFKIPNTDDDKQLELIRGETRWLYFKENARGLSQVLQSSKKAIIKYWGVAENKFPDHVINKEVIDTLVTIQGDSKKEEVFEYLHDKLLLPADLKLSPSVNQSFVAQVQGKANYDQFLMRNWQIRKVCPELYIILTHPLMISTLSQYWQQKFTPDKLDDLVFQLKDINSNNDLHRILHDFFGINLDDALTKIGISSATVLGFSARQLKLQAQKAVNFDKIDDPLLRDYFKASSLLLEEKNTNTFVQIINRCMRENTDRDPRSKKIKIIAAVKKSKISEEVKKTIIHLLQKLPHEFFAGSKISLKEFYLQFASHASPKIERINDIDMTTRVNQMLRDMFLKQGWHLSAQHHRILHVNYGLMNYETFIHDYLCPAASKPIDEIRKVFKVKDYLKLQTAYMAAHMEMKSVAAAFDTFKKLPKIDLFNLEKVLKDLKNEPDAASKIATNVKDLISHLPAQIVNRKKLAIELGAIKELIETYRSSGVYYNGFLNRQKQIDTAETLKNILKKLSVNYSVGSEMYVHIHDILNKMNSDKRYKLDVETQDDKIQVIQHILGIYHTLENAEHIDKMIQQNQVELDQLEKILPLAQKFNDSIHENERNRLLPRQEQHITVPYSQVGSLIDLKSDQKVIEAEQKKLKQQMTPITTTEKTLERKALQNSTIPLYDRSTGTSALFSMQDNKQTLTFSFELTNSFLNTYTQKNTKLLAQFWESFAMPVTVDNLWKYAVEMGEKDRINKAFCKGMVDAYYKKFFKKLKNGFYDTFYLPNLEIFQIVLKHLSMQAELTKGKQFTLETNDYAVYIAAQCIAKLNGYTIKSYSFQNTKIMQNLQENMPKYLKALEDPKNGYQALFRTKELASTVQKFKKT